MNAVIETTELGYKINDMFQVFRGDPSTTQSELIPNGFFFNVIAFGGNLIKIDYYGEDMLIHEDYCKIHY